MNTNRAVAQIRKAQRALRCFATTISPGDTCEPATAMEMCQQARDYGWSPEKLHDLATELQVIANEIERAAGWRSLKS